MDLLSWICLPTALAENCECESQISELRCNLEFAGGSLDSNLGACLREDTNVGIPRLCAVAIREWLRI